jgi:hypothetical protein
VVVAVAKTEMELSQSKCLEDTDIGGGNVSF